MRTLVRVMVLVVGSGLLVPREAAAQQAVGSSTVLINFTGFTGTGFAPTPATGQLSTGVWSVAGFSDPDLAFGGTSTTGDYARGQSAGGVTVAGIYAFSSGGDVFLGIQPAATDFVPGTLTARFSNALAEPITALDLSYRVMTLNDQNRSTAVTFAYSTDGTTFTPVAALDYATPGAQDTAGWGLTDRMATLPLSVAPAGLFYLRWLSADVSGTGQRDEFGIDDITIQAGFCGNGAVNGAEVCDDGNAVETDACLSTCVAASCGDGFIRAGTEDCETGECCTSGCDFAAAGAACTGGTCNTMGTCVPDEVPMGSGGEGGEPAVGVGGEGGEPAVGVGGEGGDAPTAGTAGSGAGTAGAAGTAGSGAGTAGAGPSGGGSSGSAGAPAVGGSAGANIGTGGASGSAGAGGGSTAKPPAATDDGGCSCALPGTSRKSDVGLALLGALVAAALGRRRARARN